MHREFALYIKENYPEWLRDLNGNRPPLSIDIVAEFLLPILERDKAAVFIVVDCLRLDQWRGVWPVLCSFFLVGVAPYSSVRPPPPPCLPPAFFLCGFPSEVSAPRSRPLGEG